jgi:hypothetical protein
MNNFIGGVRNLFSSTSSSISAKDYSKLPNLSIGGMPLLTFGLMGVTTVVLATITLSESSGKSENEESFVSKLPSMSTAPNPVVPGEAPIPPAPITSDNAPPELTSPEENKEEAAEEPKEEEPPAEEEKKEEAAAPAPATGGKKTRKHKKKKHAKRKHRKNKTKRTKK